MSIIPLCRYVSTKPEQQLAIVLPGWVSRSGPKIWGQGLLQAIVATWRGSVLGAPPNRFRQLQCFNGCRLGAPQRILWQTFGIAGSMLGAVQNAYNLLHRQWDCEKILQRQYTGLKLLTRMIFIHLYRYGGVCGYMSLVKIVVCLWLCWRQGDARLSE